MAWDRIRAYLSGSGFGILWDANLSDLDNRLKTIQYIRRFPEILLLALLPFILRSRNLRYIPGLLQKISPIGIRIRI